MPSECYCVTEMNLVLRHPTQAARDESDMPSNEHNLRDKKEAESQLQIH